MANRPRPGVDILIPFHGKYEYATKCVESILAKTPNQEFNIYLIDDGSPNESFISGILRGSSRIKGIRMPEQVGFGAALHEGYKQSSNPWIVIMHSDVTVPNIYWLLNLQRTMEKLKTTGVKLVSARTNHMGTSSSFIPELLGEEGSVIEDKISETSLPLFCALCHRELFKRIGGFIKSYPYTWYEDEELYWRMKYYRFSQAVCGSSWVNHVGGVTVEDIWKTQPKSKEIMESNRDRCLKDIAPYIRKKT